MCLKHSMSSQYVFGFALQVYIWIILCTPSMYFDHLMPSRYVFGSLFLLPLCIWNLICPLSMYFGIFYARPECHFICPPSMYIWIILCPSSMYLDHSICPPSMYLNHSMSFLLYIYLFNFVCKMSQHKSKDDVMKDTSNRSQNGVTTPVASRWQDLDYSDDTTKVGSLVFLYHLGLLVFVLFVLSVLSTLSTNQYFVLFVLFELCFIVYFPFCTLLMTLSNTYLSLHFMNIYVYDRLSNSAVFV